MTKRREQHGQVQMNVAAALKRLAEELAHGGRQPPGHQQADNGRDQAEDQVLQQDLPHDAHPARTQRGANGHLPLTRHAARQQHDRHIHAGDQQHEHHAGSHHPQRLALVLTGNRAWSAA